ncbi:MAG: four helix bundle protein [Patescibacteria group bacterium]
MEDKIWDIDERTFQFAVRIIGMTRALPTKETVSWILGKQIIRSGTSVNSNIIHAKSATSNKDFCYYLRVALREARETKRWLEMIVAAGLISKERMSFLIKESDEIISILVTSVKKSDHNNNS